MSGPAKIRVLVADDHPIVLRGLVATLNQAPDLTVIAEATNGHEAAALFAECRPDLGLIDLYMPTGDGAAAIEAIRVATPAARLVILTTYDGEEDIYRALRAGAKGYLLKDDPIEEILTCIRAVHRGERYLPRRVAGKLAERIDGRELTPRELEVLRLMAEGRANKQIAAALGVTEGTVKAHMNNLYQKLSSGSRTEALMEAIRRGLVRRP